MIQDKSSLDMMKSKSVQRRLKVQMGDDKFLKSKMFSDLNRYKVCIVHKSKKKLLGIIEQYEFYKIGSENRTGWIGFVYLDNFKDAIKLREELYNNKECYVIIQDEKQLIDYYKKKGA